MSAIESLANLIIGFSLAVLLQIVLFPVMGLAVTVPQSLGIGSVFTLLSVLRSYAVRRLFARIGG
ncbi:hypothetical protein [Pseudooceanicola sp.]|uniref:DUF7220 family protein n=1 Tax=Pseudooceanicola sp. TaxID=1914328 RepID=UPI0035C677D4